jgi:dolichyl-phosphate-mannose-protein mannosyltransferase
MEAPILEVKPATAVGGESGPANDDLYALLLLAALVFITIFPWHAVNQRLPIWDGANFVLTSQKIADAFDAGFLAGLKALYLERWWRPILFPTVAAPFFLLGGGQIRLSVGLTQFTFALVLVVYVYRFLRQEYSVSRSLTGSLVILGAPWLVNFSQQFYSELLWLAAMAGLIHHLSAALRQSFRLQYGLAGAWLGLMAATRPIETVVVMFVPAAAFLAYDTRRKTVKAVDIAVFAVQLLAVIIAVALLVMPERHEYAVSFLLVASLVIIGLRARQFWVDSPFLVFLVTGQLISVAWHLPTIRTLYLWVQQTSFGSLAQITDQRFKGVSPLVIFTETLNEYSPRVLLAVAVLAVPAVCSFLASPRNGAHSRSAALVAAAVLMIAPMLVLYSLSGTSDARRIMPGILLLYIGLTAFAFSPRGLLPRVRLAGGLGMAVALLMAAAANGLNVKSNALLNVQETFGYLKPPATGQDPTGPVLESLLRMGVSSGNIAAYSHCYHSTRCQSQNVPWVEAVALSTLARERHLPLYVHFMDDLDFSRPETLAKQMQARGFQYVLIDMLDAPEDVNHADTYVMHTDHFIAMERETLPPGLTSRGCFATLNRRTCVIEVGQSEQ